MTAITKKEKNTSSRPVRGAIMSAHSNKPRAVLALSVMKHKQREYVYKYIDVDGHEPAGKDTHLSNTCLHFGHQIMLQCQPLWPNKRLG